MHIFRFNILLQLNCCRKCLYQFTLLPSYGWVPVYLSLTIIRLKFCQYNDKVVIVFGFLFFSFVWFFVCVFCFVMFCFVFLLFRATPTAYGGSQARHLIGATAAGHSHSHSNARSEARLQPTPQLMATPDP